MKKHILNASERTIIGKKVKLLRASGKAPATVYGKKIKSESLQVDSKEFAKVYADAGETGLIDLKIGALTKPVLIHTVQINPVTSKIIHVEFYEVDLKEKVHAKVPIEFIGVSQAVAQHQGVLLTIMDEVEVEALPTDLPEKISIDISRLTNVDQELKVSDLKVDKEVIILADQNQAIAKIGALVTKEVEAQAQAEAAAAAEAAAQAAPIEGVTESPTTIEGTPTVAETPEKAQSEKTT